MLEQLYLRYFRNYKELIFEPGPGLSVLTGPNGSGKSNLLEGIFYLGAGYPYRIAHDEALVSWGADFFAIRARVLKGNIRYDIEIAYQSETSRKTIKINGKREHAGVCASCLPVVVFSPADLLLIQGPPGLRRRFLDLVATQVQAQHAADLHDYGDVLNQRNNLLRRGGYHREELQPWDEQLVALGARIINRRLSVFRELLGHGRSAFATLSCNGELDGAYISHVTPPFIDKDVSRAAFGSSLEITSEGMPGGAHMSERRIISGSASWSISDSKNGRPEQGHPGSGEELCRQAFQEALERRRSLDERLRMTTVGPHRDDLRFFLQGHEARLYCSQGEQRLIALSLKLAQSRILSGLQGSETLLLLDDVFSELDAAHRERVLQEASRCRQAIATTTSLREGDVPVGQLTPLISLYRVANWKQLQ
jgi:DNA replication and repair protein RecF